ncbi:hypothetical protein LOTGIDRAFT_234000 [Lottia gigantea]|uniref:Tafazzin family protein n=1 Tax=Lottia gigantea TaxID=225164 RepID=V4A9A7_LOTGI|nr:hypothetical protein LOTGIDRAFT_234000 [Lottia gigantea]ESO89856.1 hypothetical protein LOTGIDRAFT_234000 [Lottia gigantea]
MVRQPINHSGLKLWKIYQQPRLPLYFETLRRAVIWPVSVVAKIYMGCLNNLTVYNNKTLENAICYRENKQPLITVSNHYCCLDEPLMWTHVKWKYITNPEKTRWDIGAHDVVFTNYLYSFFGNLSKVIPVERGKGVYQDTVDFLIQRLNLGDWVHIFPEGKINLNKERIRLKWGVGRMIFECTASPIVLPIWHCGMDDILPNTRPYIPQLFKKVTYLVGAPMDFTEDVVKLKSLNKSPREIRKHITDKIQEVLFALREQAEALHGR